MTAWNSGASLQSGNNSSPAVHPHPSHAVKSPPLTFQAVAVVANSKGPAGPPPLLTATCTSETTENCRSLRERAALQHEGKCTAYDVSLKLWHGGSGMNRVSSAPTHADVILCGSQPTPQDSPSLLAAVSSLSYSGPLCNKSGEQQRYQTSAQLPCSSRENSKRFILQS